MKILDGKAAVSALGIATTVLVFVVVILLGIDDFLSRVIGLSGGHWMVWFDISSNLVMMFVLIAVVLYAARIMKGGS